MTYVVIVTFDAPPLPGNWQAIPGYYKPAGIHVVFGGVGGGAKEDCPIFFFSWWGTILEYFAIAINGK